LTLYFSPFQSATPEDGHAANTRQEDNQADQSELPTIDGEEGEEEEEGDGERDLDEEMEDRDVSFESAEGDGSR
jgi:hypothetical protein